MKARQLGLVEINPETLAKRNKSWKPRAFRLGYQLDVTDYDTYAKAIADVVEKWGHLDILVNNAAIAVICDHPGG